jgi:hypothetical protein
LEDEFCESETASEVVLIAKAFGWSEDYILSLPIERRWSYVRLLLKSAD